LKWLTSDRERPAKPEEIVRQLWIKKLLDEFHYCKDHLKIEYSVWFGSGMSYKSADIDIVQNNGEHFYLIFKLQSQNERTDSSN
jgi:type I restriction enzyme M protein